MKINWILPEVSQCGGVRVVLQYANELVGMGHDVVCYAPKSGQHFGWKRIFFPKEVLRMKFSSELRGEWFSNKFQYEFPMWISNRSIRDADITIATSWITSYWVSKLDMHKGKKVYFIQDFETWGDDRYNEIVKASYKLRFDKCITVSTALHNLILKETEMDSVVVCNGVEECFLKESKKNTNQITIGMPYREIRGNDIKNCALGLNVLIQIKEKYLNVNLAAFGFKKPRDWCGQIEFLENPTREELVEFYGRINILYVPSVYEGWGLPAMEAMAQGNAIVAGDSGIIQEIGVDEHNCIILQNPLDEGEAIKKIIYLIENQEQMEKIGLRAKKCVSNMSQQHSAKKLEKILRDIC